MAHRTAPPHPDRQVPPHPRRPQRGLLLVSSIALGAWVVFLVLTALRVV